MASCFFIIYDDTVQDSGWFKGQIQKSIETFVTHRLNVHCSHWSIALWEGNWFSNLTLSEKAKKRIFQDVELFFSFMIEQVCVMDVSLRCAAAWCCIFCGETVENSAQKASGPFQTGSFLKAAAAVITNDSTWMVPCPLVCHLNTIHAENQRWLLLPDAPPLENDFWNVAVLLINGWMEAQKVQTSPLRRRWVIKIKCLNGSPVTTESGSRSKLISSLQVDNESCVNTGSQFVLTHSPTHRRSPVWLWESQHSDPVVPEWFTPSVFRCISLSKHPGARSQAVKLFCALTNKPSSLTARNRQAKMTRSSVVFGTSVMGATVPSEEDRLAYLNPSPSKKAPITEAITPSRDWERQHKQCAGTPRSSPHIQLQSRWSHVVSRCGCSSQSAVTRESLHAALWSTASRHQHAGGDAYVMKYAAKKNVPLLQTNKIFFNVEMMCRYQAGISAAEVNKTSGIKIQFHSCCCLVTSFMWLPSISILPRQINRVKVNGYSQEKTYFLCCLSSDYSK